MKENRSAKIIAIFGSKGGVGKTTVSVNLATALANVGNHCVLVDYDLQFGDAAIFLDLENKHGIGEMVQEASLTKEVVQRYLIPHPSGLRLLPSSDRPEYADMVTATHAAEIINEVMHNEDFILVDLDADERFEYNGAGESGHNHPFGESGYFLTSKHEKIT